MKILKFRDKKEAIEKASTIIIDLIKKNPKAVLGLATGGTMVPLYKKIAKEYKKQNLDFSKLKTFNLDEYAGIKDPLTNRNSYHYYMDKNIFSKVNIQKRNINFPSASEPDYDKQIKRVGGLDLCLLGIGRNGHIAFNEPGSSFKSITRKVKLTDNTIKANSRFFRSTKQVPREAYTMGISTILKSKKIILLAFGNKKAKAIKKVVKEKVSKRVPASILHKHNNTTLILDSRAASLI